MRTVFLLHHIHKDANLPDGEDVKIIGIYSLRTKAEGAVARLSTQPGFREAKEGFQIEEYEIDKDHWTEGFTTIRQES